MDDFAVLLENTLKLHPNERAILAEEILKSLDQPNEQIDKIWKEEALKRYKAYKENKVGVKSVSDVLTKYE